MRGLLVAAVIIVACVCLRISAESALPPGSTKGSAVRGLGFDFRPVIGEHQKLIGAGKSEEALEHLMKWLAPSAKAMLAPQSEQMKKQWAILYGAGGKFVGHEVIGCKRLGSRLCKVFVLSHYEQVKVWFWYAFEKTADTCSIVSFGYSDKLDELEKLVTFQPLDEFPTPAGN